MPDMVAATVPARSICPTANQLADRFRSAGKFRADELALSLSDQMIEFASHFDLSFNFVSIMRSGERLVSTLDDADNIDAQAVSVANLTTAGGTSSSLPGRKSCTCSIRQSVAVRRARCVHSQHAATGSRRRAHGER
jgi:hypothetical protein